MQYAAFVFGIFGLLAYLELSSLKSRITELERELTKIKGTSYHEDRTSLLKAAQSYTGKKVELDMSEDNMDADVVMYGNTKHGSITILDSDEDWMLVRIETPKGDKTKLLRMESIERITVISGFVNKIV